MAKKSMIAKNEKRKVIVARYATKRLELKKALVDRLLTSSAKPHASVCRSFRAMLRPCACVVVTQLMAVRVDS